MNECFSHIAPGFSQVGQHVDIKVNPAVQKGMPYLAYQGRTGIIWNVTPRAVGVELNKQVRLTLELRGGGIDLASNPKLTLRPHALCCRLVGASHESAFTCALSTCSILAAVRISSSAVRRTTRRNTRQRPRVVSHPLPPSSRSYFIAHTCCSGDAPCTHKTL